ncbi:hypothetical protein F5148DRAFT_1252215 [Russula earlei]|uniref:Uncharacterized protein n=1 Tax=Russula earlei TaxID=71964 RepID=A0ACC0TVA5_9AGAM|nr:hypothetical protein F5148DRAFT_1252215 [Russula earlei]
MHLSSVDGSPLTRGETRGVAINQSGSRNVHRPISDSPGNVTERTSTRRRSRSPRWDRSNDDPRARETSRFNFSRMYCSQSAISGQRSTTTPYLLCSRTIINASLSPTNCTTWTYHSEPEYAGVRHPSLSSGWRRRAVFLVPLNLFIYPAIIEPRSDELLICDRPSFLPVAPRDACVSSQSEHATPTTVVNGHHWHHCAHS